MAGVGIAERWKVWRTRWLGKDKTMRILLWVGLLGILLIGLSELFPSCSREETTSVTLTANQVEKALEQRIADLLRQVEGVGTCRVMVTLERDAQTVYATDTVADGQQVLVVETDAGPVGLPLTTLLPSVKGVAVVCDGGGDAAVCERVTQLVATAFHISQRRVYVAPQK